MRREPAVLVVEDDPSIASLVMLILEDAGYSVHSVSTAEDAIVHLDIGQLDLIILDWMLPDMQGDQLCQLIKQHSASTFLPVLMLTARGDLADRIAGLDAGADDYLTKPFHVDELLARVRALLRIRAAEAERFAMLNALAWQRDALKEAYDQLRAAQSQLIQSSKLAALGELVAGVAHELNNPLAIILGNAELLPELENEEDRRAVTQIIASAQRARRVVQSLVTFARCGKIDEDWYSPYDLVERVLDLKRATLRTAGITLEVTYNSDLPSIWVDGPQIQQVLLNLMGNAEHALAGRPDSRIVVRVSVMAMPVPQPQVLPDLDTPNSSGEGEHALVFDIADNGPGLVQEVIERIFQPFVTTKPVGQGTGLGLAISYGIVMQHGGTMLFASELDRGVTFRVVLPINIETRVRPKSEQLIAPIHSSGIIMVVDDERDILDVITRLLSTKGYIVTPVSNARQALELLQRQPCDLILCDIKMPDMDGIMFFEAFQELKIAPRPQLLIMTGDTSNARTDQFLQQHRFAVLHKPFTSNELLQAVTHALGNEGDKERMVGKIP